jgi:hypothetical protein
MGDMQRECSEVKVYINVVSVNECPTANDTIYTVDEGGTLTITGLAGGSDGTFRIFPAIMGNDFDYDIGSRPNITDNLIAFYSMSEYFDSIPGPDLDLDGEMIRVLIILTVSCWVEFQILYLSLTPLIVKLLRGVNVVLLHIL